MRFSSSACTSACASSNLLAPVLAETHSCLELFQSDGPSPLAVAVELSQMRALDGYNGVSLRLLEFRRPNRNKWVWLLMLPAACSVV